MIRGDFLNRIRSRSALAGALLLCLPALAGAGAVVVVDQVDINFDSGSGLDFRNDRNQRVSVPRLNVVCNDERNPTYCGPGASGDFWSRTLGTRSDLVAQMYHSDRYVNTSPNDIHLVERLTDGEVPAVGPNPIMMLLSSFVRQRETASRELRLAALPVYERRRLAIQYAYTLKALARLQAVADITPRNPQNEQRILQMRAADRFLRAKIGYIGGPGELLQACASLNQLIPAPSTPVLGCEATLPRPLRLNDDLRAILNVVDQVLPTAQRVTVSAPVQGRNVLIAPQAQPQRPPQPQPRAQPAPRVQPAADPGPRPQPPARTLTTDLLEASAASLDAAVAAADPFRTAFHVFWAGLASQANAAVEALQAWLQSPASASAAPADRARAQALLSLIRSFIPRGGLIGGVSESIRREELRRLWMSDQTTQARVERDLSAVGQGAIITARGEQARTAASRALLDRLAASGIFSGDPATVSRRLAQFFEGNEANIRLLTESNLAEAVVPWLQSVAEHQWDVSTVSAMLTRRVVEQLRIERASQQGRPDEARLIAHAALNRQVYERLRGAGRLSEYQAFKELYESTTAPRSLAVERRLTELVRPYIDAIPAFASQLRYTASRGTAWSLACGQEAPRDIMARANFNSDRFCRDAEYRMVSSLIEAARREDVEWADAAELVQREYLGPDYERAANLRAGANAAQRRAAAERLLQAALRDGHEAADTLQTSAAFAARSTALSPEAQARMRQMAAALASMIRDQDDLQADIRQMGDGSTTQLLFSRATELKAVTHAAVEGISAAPDAEASCWLMDIQNADRTCTVARRRAYQAGAGFATLHMDRVRVLDPHAAQFTPPARATRDGLETTSGGVRRFSTMDGSYAESWSYARDGEGRRLYMDRSGRLSAETSAARGSLRDVFDVSVEQDGRVMSTTFYRAQSGDTAASQFTFGGPQQVTVGTPGAVYLSWEGRAPPAEVNGELQTRVISVQGSGNWTSALTHARRDAEGLLQTTATDALSYDGQTGRADLMRETIERSPEGEVYRDSTRYYGERIDHPWGRADRLPDELLAQLDRAAGGQAPSERGTLVSTSVDLTEAQARMSAAELRPLLLRVQRRLHETGEWVDNNSQTVPAALRQLGAGEEGARASVSFTPGATEQRCEMVDNGYMDGTMHVGDCTDVKVGGASTNVLVSRVNPETGAALNRQMQFMEVALAGLRDEAAHEPEGPNSVQMGDVRAQARFQEGALAARDYLQRQGRTPQYEMLAVQNDVRVGADGYEHVTQRVVGFACGTPAAPQLCGLARGDSLTVGRETSVGWLVTNEAGQRLNEQSVVVHRDYDWTEWGFWEGGHRFADGVANSILYSDWGERNPFWGAICAGVAGGALDAVLDPNMVLITAATMGAGTAGAWMTNMALRIPNAVLRAVVGASGRVILIGKTGVDTMFQAQLAIGAASAVYMGGHAIATGDNQELYEASRSGSMLVAQLGVFGAFGRWQQGRHAERQQRLEQERQDRIERGAPEPEAPRTYEPTVVERTLDNVGARVQEFGQRFVYTPRLEPRADGEPGYQPRPLSLGQRVWNMTPLGMAGHAMMTMGGAFRGHVGPDPFMANAHSAQRSGLTNARDRVTSNEGAADTDGAAAVTGAGASGAAVAAGKTAQQATGAQGATPNTQAAAAQTGAAPNPALQGQAAQSGGQAGVQPSGAQSSAQTIAPGASGPQAGVVAGLPNANVQAPTAERGAATQADASLQGEALAGDARGRAPPRQEGGLRMPWSRPRAPRPEAAASVDPARLTWMSAPPRSAPLPEVGRLSEALPRGRERTADSAARDSKAAAPEARTPEGKAEVIEGPEVPAEFASRNPLALETPLTARLFDSIEPVDRARWNVELDAEGKPVGPKKNDVLREGMNMLFRDDSHVRVTRTLPLWKRLARRVGLDYVAPDSVEAVPMWVMATVVRMENGNYLMRRFDEFLDEANGGRLAKRALWGVFTPAEVRAQFRPVGDAAFINGSLQAAAGKGEWVHPAYRPGEFATEAAFNARMLERLNGSGRPQEIADAYARFHPAYEGSTAGWMGTHEPVVNRDHLVVVAEEALRVVEGRKEIDPGRRLHPEGSLTLRGLIIMLGLHHDYKSLASARTGRGNQDHYNDAMLEGFLRSLLRKDPPAAIERQVAVAKQLLHEKAIFEIVFDEPAGYRGQAQTISSVESLAKLKQAHSRVADVMSLQEYAELTLAYSLGDSVAYGDRQALRVLNDRVGEFGGKKRFGRRAEATGASGEYYDRTLPPDSEGGLRGRALSADVAFPVPGAGRDGGVAMFNPRQAIDVLMTLVQLDATLPAAARSGDPLAGLTRGPPAYDPTLSREANFRRQRAYLDAVVTRTGESVATAHRQVQARVASLEAQLGQAIARGEKPESLERLRAEREDALAAQGHIEAERARAIALHILESARSRGIENLNAEELSYFWGRLRENRLWAEMETLYRAAADPAFRGSTQVRVELAAALNLAGKLGAAERLLLSMPEMRLDGEVSGLLGKFELERHGRYAQAAREAREAGKERLAQVLEAEARASLERSVNVLHDGFEASGDQYPGVNYLHNRIKLARLAGDRAQLDAALADAPLVYLAARQAAGPEPADYWSAASLLTGALLSGDAAAAREALGWSLYHGRVEAQLDRSILKLQELRETLTDLGATPSPEMDAALAALQARRANVYVEAPRPQRNAVDPLAAAAQARLDAGDGLSPLSAAQRLGGLREALGLDAVPGVAAARTAVEGLRDALASYDPALPPRYEPSAVERLLNVAVRPDVVRGNGALERAERRAALESLRDASGEPLLTPEQVALAEKAHDEVPCRVYECSREQLARKVSLMSSIPPAARGRVIREGLAGGADPLPPEGRGPERPAARALPGFRAAADVEPQQLGGFRLMGEADGGAFVRGGEGRLRVYEPAPASVPKGERDVFRGDPAANLQALGEGAAFFGVNRLARGGMTHPDPAYLADAVRRYNEGATASERIAVGFAPFAGEIVAPREAVRSFGREGLLPLAERGDASVHDGFVHMQAVLLPPEAVAQMRAHNRALGDFEAFALGRLRDSGASPARLAELSARFDPAFEQLAKDQDGATAGPRDFHALAPARPDASATLWTLTAKRYDEFAPPREALRRRLEEPLRRDPELGRLLKEFEAGPAKADPGYGRGLSMTPESLLRRVEERRGLVAARLSKLAAAAPRPERPLTPGVARATVESNARLDPAARAEALRALRGEDGARLLDEAQVAAVMRAHEEVRCEVYRCADWQLRDKLRIMRGLEPQGPEGVRDFLAEAGHNDLIGPALRDRLLREGLAGMPAPAELPADPAYTVWRSIGMAFNMRWAQPEGVRGLKGFRFEGEPRAWNLGRWRMLGTAPAETGVGRIRVFRRMTDGRMTFMDGPRDLFRGDNNWNIDILGKDAASFFGIRRLSGELYTQGDAAFTADAIKRFNDGAPEGERIPVGMYDFGGANGKVSDREYAERWARDGELPISKAGDEAVHDVNFHLGGILLPPDAVALSRNQTRAILDFADFVSRRRMMTLGLSGAARRTGGHTGDAVKNQALMVDFISGSVNAALNNAKTESQEFQLRRYFDEGIHHGKSPRETLRSYFGYRAEAGELLREFEAQEARRMGPAFDRGLDWDVREIRSRLLDRIQVVARRTAILNKEAPRRSFAAQTTAEGVLEVARLSPQQRQARLRGLKDSEGRPLLTQEQVDAVMRAHEDVPCQVTRCADWQLLDKLRIMRGLEPLGKDGTRDPLVERGHRDLIGPALRDRLVREGWAGQPPAAKPRFWERIFGAPGLRRTPPPPRDAAALPGFRAETEADAEGLAGFRLAGSAPSASVVPGGREGRVLVLERPASAEQRTERDRFRGEPGWNVDILGVDGAALFGVRRLNKDLVTLGDAATVNEGIARYNAAVPEGERIAVRMYEFEADSGKVADREYVERFVRDGELPISVAGDEGVHDVSFHLASILLPPEAVAVARSQLRVFLDFEAFAREQRARDPGREALWAELEQDLGRVIERGGRDVDFFTGGVSVAMTATRFPERALEVYVLVGYNSGRSPRENLEGYVRYLPGAAALKDGIAEFTARESHELGAAFEAQHRLSEEAMLRVLRQRAADIGRRAASLPPAAPRAPPSARRTARDPRVLAVAALEPAAREAALRAMRGEEGAPLLDDAQVAAVMRAHEEVRCEVYSCAPWQLRDKLRIMRGLEPLGPRGRRDPIEEAGRFDLISPAVRDRLIREGFAGMPVPPEPVPLARPTLWQRLGEFVGARWAVPEAARSLPGFRFENEPGFRELRSFRLLGTADPPPGEPGRIRVYRKFADVDVLDQNQRDRFRGDPQWNIDILGESAASFLGIRRLSDGLYTQGDAAYTQAALARYNAAAPEGERVAVGMYDFAGDKGKVSDREYVLRWARDGELPISVVGDEAFHDVNFHLGGILLPPDAVALSRAQSQVFLDFADFVAARATADAGVARPGWWKAQRAAQMSVRTQGSMVDIVTGGVNAAFNSRDTASQDYSLARFVEQGLYGGLSPREALRERLGVGKTEAETIVRRILGELNLGRDSYVRRLVEEFEAAEAQKLGAEFDRPLGWTPKPEEIRARLLERMRALSDRMGSLSGARPQPAAAVDAAGPVSEAVLAVARLSPQQRQARLRALKDTDGSPLLDDAQTQAVLHAHEDVSCVVGGCTKAQLRDKLLIMRGLQPVQAERRWGQVERAAPEHRDLIPARVRDRLIREGWAGQPPPAAPAGEARASFPELRGFRAQAEPEPEGLNWYRLAGTADAAAVHPGARGRVLVYSRKPGAENAEYTQRDGFRGDPRWVLDTFGEGVSLLGFRRLGPDAVTHGDAAMVSHGLQVYNRGASAAERIALDVYPYDRDGGSVGDREYARRFAEEGRLPIAARGDEAAHDAWVHTQGFLLPPEAVALAREQARAVLDFETFALAGLRRAGAAPADVAIVRAALDQAVKNQARMVDFVTGGVNEVMTASSRENQIGMTDLYVLGSLEGGASPRQALRARLRRALQAEPRLEPLLRRFEARPERGAAFDRGLGWDKVELHRRLMARRDAISARMAALTGSAAKPKDPVVLTVAAMKPAERLQRLRTLDDGKGGRLLNEEQAQAVMRAHEEVRCEVYKCADWQLRDKLRIMRGLRPLGKDGVRDPLGEAGHHDLIAPAVRDRLIREGYAGRAPAGEGRGAFARFISRFFRRWAPRDPNEGRQSVPEDDGPFVFESFQSGQSQPSGGGRTAEAERTATAPSDFFSHTVVHPPAASPETQALPGFRPESEPKADSSLSHRLVGSLPADTLVPGARGRLRVYEGARDAGNRSERDRFRGNLQWNIDIMGADAAALLGIRRLSEREITMGDAEATADAIARYNEVAPEAERIPVSVYDFGADAGKVGDREYAERFARDGELPLSEAGDEGYHDAAFHMGAIFLPPEAVAQARLQTQARLDFEAFVRDQRKQRPGREAEWQAIDAMWPSFWEQAGRDVDFFTGGVNAAFSAKDRSYYVMGIERFTDGGYHGGDSPRAVLERSLPYGTRDTGLLADLVKDFHAQEAREMGPAYERALNWNYHDLTKRIDQRRRLLGRRMAAFLKGEEAPPLGVASRRPVPDFSTVWNNGNQPPARRLERLRELKDAQGRPLLTEAQVQAVMRAHEDVPCRVYNCKGWEIRDKVRILRGLPPLGRRGGRASVPAGHVDLLPAELRHRMISEGWAGMPPEGVRESGESRSEPAVSEPVQEPLPPQWAFPLAVRALLDPAVGTRRTLPFQAVNGPRIDRLAAWRKANPAETDMPAFLMPKFTANDAAEARAHPTVFGASMLRMAVFRGDVFATEFYKNMMMETRSNPLSPDFRNWTEARWNEAFEKQSWLEWLPGEGRYELHEGGAQLRLVEHLEAATKEMNGVDRDSVVLHRGTGRGELLYYEVIGRLGRGDKAGAEQAAAALLERPGLHPAVRDALKLVRNPQGRNVAAVRLELATALGKAYEGNWDNGAIFTTPRRADAANFGLGAVARFEVPFWKLWNMAAKRGAYVGTEAGYVEIAWRTPEGLLALADGYQGRVEDFAPEGGWVAGDMKRTLTGIWGHEPARSRAKGFAAEAFEALLAPGLPLLDAAEAGVFPSLRAGARTRSNAAPVETVLRNARLMEELSGEKRLNHIRTVLGPGRVSREDAQLVADAHDRFPCVVGRCGENTLAAKMRTMRPERPFLQRQALRLMPRLARRIGLRTGVPLDVAVRAIQLGLAGRPPPEGQTVPPMAGRLEVDSPAPREEGSWTHLAAAPPKAEVMDWVKYIRGLPDFAMMDTRYQICLNLHDASLQNRRVHSELTAEVGAELARRLGLGEDAAALAYATGLAHDLGHGPFSHEFERAVQRRLDPYDVSYNHDAAGLRALHGWGVLPPDALPAPLAESVAKRDWTFDGERPRSPYNRDPRDLPAELSSRRDAGALALPLGNHLEGLLSVAGDRIAFNSTDISDVLRVGRIRPEQLKTRFPSAYRAYREALAQTAQRFRGSEPLETAMARIEADPELADYVYRRFPEVFRELLMGDLLATTRGNLEMLEASGALRDAADVRRHVGQVVDFSPGMKAEFDRFITFSEVEMFRRTAPLETLAGAVIDAVNAGDPRVPLPPEWHGRLALTNEPAKRILLIAEYLTREVGDMQMLELARKADPALYDSAFPGFEQVRSRALSDAEMALRVGGEGVWARLEGRVIEPGEVLANARLGRGDRLTRLRGLRRPDGRPLLTEAQAQAVLRAHEDVPCAVFGCEAWQLRDKERIMRGLEPLGRAGTPRDAAAERAHADIVPPALRGLMIRSGYAGSTPPEIKIYRGPSLWSRLRSLLPVRGARPSAPKGPLPPATLRPIEPAAAPTQAQLRGADAQTLGRKLFAVHARRMMPQDGVLRPAGVSRDGVAHRGTLHFSLGARAKSHENASFESADIAVVTPLSGLEGSLVNVNFYDTFTLGPLDLRKLPPEARLIVPVSRAHEVPAGVKVETYDPGEMRLERAVDAVVAREGGWRPEMNERIPQLDTIAEVGGVSVNDAAFFRPLLEQRPGLSFGSHIDSEVGEAGRLGDLEQSVTALLQSRLKGGRALPPEAAAHLVSVLRAQVQALDRAVPTWGLDAPARAEYAALRAQAERALSSPEPRARGERQGVDYRFYGETVAGLAPAEALPLLDAWARAARPADAEVRAARAHYALRRAAALGPGRAQAEGLIALADAALEGAAPTRELADALTDAVIEFLDPRAGRLGFVLELLARPGARAVLEGGYGVRFPAAGSLTLEGFMAAHPRTAPLFRGPPPSLTVTDKMLDAVEPFADRRGPDWLKNGFRWASWSGSERYAIETRRRYLPQLSDPIASSRENPGHFVFALSRRVEAPAFWRSLGLEAEYRAAYKDDRAFWKERRSLLEVHAALLERRASFEDAVAEARSGDPFAAIVPKASRAELAAKVQGAAVGARETARLGSGTEAAGGVFAVAERTAEGVELFSEKHFDSPSVAAKNISALETAREARDAGLLPGLQVLDTLRGPGEGSVARFELVEGVTLSEVRWHAQEGDARMAAVLERYAASLRQAQQALNEAGWTANLSSDGGSLYVYRKGKSNSLAFQFIPNNVVATPDGRFVLIDPF